MPGGGKYQHVTLAVRRGDIEPSAQRGWGQYEMLHSVASGEGSAALIGGIIDKQYPEGRVTLAVQAFKRGELTG
ncbi:hypothetical protein GCM10017767_19240 [Halomonas urumqiensis]|nr:hypothetical protein GCM10017767_19240 [Halomonas urumqiensis]